MYFFDKIMSIKGVDPASIPSTSRKRTARTQLNPSMKKTASQQRYAIPTQNYYDSLSDEDDNSSENGVNNESSQQQTRRIKVPPIIVYSYIQNHVSTIKSIQTNLNEELELKFKGNRIIILTKNILDFNHVRKELDESNIQYSTKTPPNERELKLIIRNLPPNLSTQEIMDDLKSKNLPVIKVAQMTKKEGDKIIHVYPLYVVSFEKGTEMKNIVSHKKVCYCIVQWERAKRSEHTQCYRCQAFGHIAQNCTRTPRCVICGVDHYSKECTNKDKPPCCANCGQDHAASFKMCPRRLNLNSNKRPIISRKPNFQPNTFPPLNKNTNSVNRNTPIWPTTNNNSTNNANSTIGELISLFKSMLQNFNLENVTKNIKTLLSQINAAQDGVSKFMIVLDFVMSIFGP